MNEFGINSYDNMTNSEENLIVTSGELQSNIENGNVNMQSIYNDNSFCGPIADHIGEAWDIINRATENNINSLNKNSETLKQIHNSYIATDDHVSNELGGI